MRQGELEQFIFRGKPKGVLRPEFYSRHTLEVARDLLGKTLIVRSRPEGPLDSPNARLTIGRIVETEAYRADDPASHCSRGETPRSKIMFGPPGVAYVYFIYGNYEMLNFVTEPKGAPGAVLIRAVDPLAGLEWMRKRRPPGTSTHALTNGPGKLCQAMGSRMSHNGQSLRGPSLFVVDDGYRPAHVRVSPRVGIQQAKEAPWRFFIEENAFVSRVPQNRGSWRLKS